MYGWKLFWLLVLYVGDVEVCIFDGVNKSSKEFVVEFCYDFVIGWIRF